MSNRSPLAPTHTRPLALVPRTCRICQWASHFNNPLSRDLKGRIAGALGKLAAADEPSTGGVGDGDGSEGDDDSATAATVAPPTEAHPALAEGAKKFAVENLIYFKGSKHYIVTTVNPAALQAVRALPPRDPERGGWLRYADTVRRDAVFAALAMDVIGMPCTRSEGVHRIAAGSRLAAVPAAAKKLPLWASVTHAAHATLFDFSNSTRCLPEGGCAALLPDRQDLGVPPTVTSVVGDRLQEPFWPEGLGINRGFHNALDTAWAISLYGVSNYGTTCSAETAAAAVAVANTLYSGYSFFVTGKNKTDHDAPQPCPYKACSVDPATRYPKLLAADRAQLHACFVASKASAAAAAQRFAAVAARKGFGFKDFDADGSGAIDATELRALLQSMGGGYSPEEIAELVNEFDTDGDGVIDKDEFETLLRKARPAAPVTPPPPPPGALAAEAPREKMSVKDRIAAMKKLQTGALPSRPASRGTSLASRLGGTNPRSQRRDSYAPHAEAPRAFPAAEPAAPHAALAAAAGAAGGGGGEGADVGTSPRDALPQSFRTRSAAELQSLMEESKKPKSLRTFTSKQTEQLVEEKLKTCHLEDLLADEEFERSFKMTRDDFQHMALWKQNREKKRLGIF